MANKNPTPLQLQAEAILRAAVESPYGIVIKTPDAMRAKQVLARFRKEIGDPTFLCLTIRHSPSNPESELWLIKRSAESAPNA